MINKEYIEGIISKKEYEEVLWEYDTNLIQIIKQKENNNKKTFNLKFNNLKEKFDVMLVVKKENDVDGYCNCQRGKEGKNCEHLVWSMIKVNEEDKEKKVEDNLAKKDDYKWNILEDIANYSLANDKVDIYFEIENISRDLVDISLKISANKKKVYKVSNIEKFVSLVMDKKPLKYGKYLDVVNYELSKRDLKLVNVLNMISLRNKFTKNNAKVENLSVEDFVEVLDVLKNTYIVYKGEEFFVSKKIRDIDLFISEENENIKLSINSKDSYVFLFENIVINSITKTIYLLEEKDLKKITLLNSIDNVNDKYEMLLSKDESKKLLSDVLPKIFNEFNVNVDSSLNMDIISEKLNVEFFCYMNNKSIYIKPRFLYGKYDGDEIYDNKLIKRDIDLEEQIINSLLLQGYEYDPYIKEFYIKVEKSQFLFLTKNIFDLKQQYDVLIDESLKKAILNFDSSSVSLNVNSSSKYDYFEIDFDIPDIEVDEISEILKSFENKREYHKLSSGSFLRLNDKQVYNQLLFLKEVIKDNTYKLNTYRVPKYKAIMMQEEINNKFNKYKFNQDFLNYIDSIKLIDKIDDSLFDDKDYKLRSYQKEGVSWLSNLYEANLGALLADEMGLGKTLEVISFLSIKDIKDAIIVVPKALLYNWEHEFEKFDSSKEVVVIDGNKEQREEKIKNSKNKIILTSYNSVINDYKAYEDKNFSCVIIDEAQYIKNSQTKTARCVKMLKGDFYIALTGTPIENNLLELWSIFDFILPGYLSDLNSFNKKYKVKDEISNLDLLKKGLSPFILRRLKSDVLKQLPDKIENNLYCDLEDKQKQIYFEYVQKVQKDIDSYIKKGNYKSKGIEILSSITRLRQIAIDPGLYTKEYDMVSGKIQVFDELIEEITSSNEKVLVFSQYTVLLKKLAKNLDDKDINYYYLDGETRPKQRLMDVERFNKNKVPVYLISLKAGGVGLNLTSASNVIIMDPWWNPAVENQAIDRSHRIGQKNKVQVFRIISKGTIEEKILNLKEDKEKLISKVLENNTEDITKLSTEDLIDILT